MDGLSGWLASIATMLGGLTVALNLGSRVTGWGFLVLALGSSCWAWNAWQGHAASLLVANLAMALINAFGVWRWLGWRRRIEQGSSRAMQASAAAPVPSLVSAGGVLERPLLLPDGMAFGTVVDLMVHSATQDLAYVVVGCDGIGGLGEDFRAVPAEQLRLDSSGLHCLLAEPQLRALAPIDPTAWPVTPQSTGTSPAGGHFSRRTRC